MQTPQAPILPSSGSLDAEKLKRIYSTMLGCRMLTERLRVLVSNDVVPRDISVVTGYEALEVGALTNLNQEDCVASGRRDYVARFIQGTRPNRIFTGLSPRSDLGAHWDADTKVESTLPCSSFPAQLSQLTGAAWAFKLQKRPQAAVFLSFEPSSSADCLRDVVSFSAAYKLPMVYIIVNDGGDETDGAISSRELQHAVKAAPFEGLPCFVVDGIDAVAVYRVAQEAIRRARQGHGPAFIECRTWTSASPSRSVSVPEPAFEDPLSKMEAHLRSKKLWSDNWKLKLAQSFARQLDRAAAFMTNAARGRQATLVGASSSTTDPSPAREPGKNEGDIFHDPVVRDTGRLAGSGG
jgi:acetoin:2,6-dichlorophenolindophenol oxidoreductase subunit alpha